MTLVLFLFISTSYYFYHVAVHGLDPNSIVYHDTFFTLALIFWLASVCAIVEDIKKLVRRH